MGLHGAATAHIQAVKSTVITIIIIVLLLPAAHRGLPLSRRAATPGYAADDPKRPRGWFAPEESRLLMPWVQLLMMIGARLRRAWTMAGAQPEL